MNYNKSFLVVLFTILFFSFKCYSQESVNQHLNAKPAKINVVYRELITNENGGTTKTTEQLSKLRKFINDSIMIWASKYDLTKVKGFSDFGTFLGNKLDIPLSRKIDLTFYDKSNRREDYILWSLNPHKFEFEKTQVDKR